MFMIGRLVRAAMTSIDIRSPPGVAVLSQSTKLVLNV